MSRRQKTTKDSDRDVPRDDRRRAWIINLLLVVLTATAYAQVASFDFVSFDDVTYIVDNPRIPHGLTGDNVRWALTTDYFANWHPLTWLSYLLDAELFGVRPGPMHVVNLLFHIADSVLLFWILRRMTAAAWPSAVVALLFALHPLHVESVAWISERKDVVSTFFLLLTIAAYQAYAKRPSVARYALVAGLMALGLMAKPMLVTTPCLLLLLDYWPLDRLGTAAGTFAKRRRRAVRLFVEKIPLFGVVAVSSVLTFLAQSRAEAVTTLDALPLVARAANAAVSYIAYLQQTFWPFDLAPLYPHPVLSAADDATISAFYLRGALSAALLLVVTIAALVWGRKHRYLVVGWFWYLGTLVPVIGLVQVGMQAHADRYTYVPLIGIFIMLAWGAADLLQRWPARKTWFTAAGVAAVVACLVLTRTQVAHWRDGVTLFAHNVAVTKHNWRGEQYLAMALARQGRPDDARAHCESLLQLHASDPSLPTHMAGAYYNIGRAYEDADRIDDAAAAYTKAIELDPRDASPYNNLGLIYFRAGRNDDAIAEFRQALERLPSYAAARSNLGAALCQSGHVDEGLHELRQAVADDEYAFDARMNFGLGLSQVGRHEEAIAHFKRALAIDPTNNAARELLARSQTMP